MLQKEEKLEVRNRHFKLILILIKYFLCEIFGGLEYFGHFFAYVAHFVFLKDVWYGPRELPLQAGALPT